MQIYEELSIEIIELPDADIITSSLAFDGTDDNIDTEDPDTGWGDW